MKLSLVSDVARGTMSGWRLARAYLPVFLAPEGWREVMRQYPLRQLLSGAGTSEIGGDFGDAAPAGSCRGRKAFVARLLTPAGTSPPFRGEEIWGTARAYSSPPEGGEVGRAKRRSGEGLCCPRRTRHWRA